MNAYCRDQTSVGDTDFRRCWMLVLAYVCDKLSWAPLDREIWQSLRALHKTVCRRSLLQTRLNSIQNKLIINGGYQLPRSGSVCLDAGSISQYKYSLITEFYLYCTSISEVEISVTYRPLSVTCHAKHNITSAFHIKQSLICRVSAFCTYIQTATNLMVS